MRQPPDYAGSGVDIARAQQALERASESIRSTHGPNVLSDLSAFGGMFVAEFPEIDQPVLVSSIDGVGTKTVLAQTPEHFEGLGQDLVHHCINDILCQGARPLFFLDYIGASRIEPTIVEHLLRGMGRACRSVGCALIGGETAEMPDVYREGTFEVGGCIVGVVSRAARLPRSDIRSGDALVALASSGLHTNGYTLARKVFCETLRLSLDEMHPSVGTTLREALLAVHRCYLPALAPLAGPGGPIKGIAHITGGGMVDNVPRMLPPDCSAEIDRTSWTEPPIFSLLRQGGVADEEMLHVFNLGVGVVLAVEEETVSEVLQHLSTAGETAWRIGTVRSGTRGVVFSP